MKKQGGKLKCVIRINRNIVECKFYITEEQAQKINEGINRNIVECK